jgi:hypothetical protein
METLLAASTAYDTGRSVGMVTLGVLLVALIRRIARLRKARRARITDAIAALVVLVLLIVNLVRLGDSDDSWDSAKGAEMKAGFIDGCQSTSGTVIDCGCAFEHVASTPPYDTPDGFATLVEPVQAAEQSGDPHDIPAVLVSAIQACRLSAS